MQYKGETCHVTKWTTKYGSVVSPRAPTGPLDYLPNSVVNKDL